MSFILTYFWLKPNFEWLMVNGELGMVNGGRILYDSFGMVMENTLTAELTGALLDVPDAATGLVHLGGGRWYDPALGRPLQPNPAGGPPTMPQALNRYAATPLGQPGVYEASSSSRWYDCCQPFDIVVDSAALAAGGQLRLEVYLTSRTASIIHSGGGLPPFARNLNTQGGVKIRQGIYSPVSPHLDAGMNEDRMRWLERRLKNGTLGFSKPGRWNRWMDSDMPLIVGERNLRIGGFNLSTKGATVAEALDGGTIGFFFDAGWQMAQDWGNPYLSGSDKFYRAGITGGVGFVAGLGVAAIVGTGPVGFVISLGVGWFVEAPISNWIFQNVGLIPTRDLSPLNN